MLFWTNSVLQLSYWAFPAESIKRISKFSTFIFNMHIEYFCHGVPNFEIRLHSLIIHQNTVFFGKVSFSKPNFKNTSFEEDRVSAYWKQEQFCSDLLIFPEARARPVTGSEHQLPVAAPPCPVTWANAPDRASCRGAPPVPQPPAW